MEPDKPDALILVSSHCPHCHALEKLLRERETNDLLGKLDVINIEKMPEVAQQYGVRSVPWLQLGDFVFEETLTPVELDRWIGHAKAGDGQSPYIDYLLGHGKLSKAIEWIEKGSASLQAVIQILADPDANMNVRIGIGAILEHFEDTDEIRAIVPDLLALLRDKNSMIRTDVCHYLSLTHSEDAIEPLKQMLEDKDPQVQQVARESIDVLSEYLSPK